jgi:hypothetical protein
VRGRYGREGRFSPIATGTGCDGGRIATGELKVIAAVLEQAIDDARRGDLARSSGLATGLETNNALTFVVKGVLAFENAVASEPGREDQCEQRDPLVLRSVARA